MVVPLWFNSFETEKKNVRILWRFMTKIICWEFSVDCHCTSMFFLSNFKKELQENYQSRFLSNRIHIGAWGSIGLYFYFRFLCVYLCMQCNCAEIWCIAHGTLKNLTSITKKKDTDTQIQTRWNKFK